MQHAAWKSSARQNWGIFQLSLARPRLLFGDANGRAPDANQALRRVRLGPAQNVESLNWMGIGALNTFSSAQVVVGGERFKVFTNSRFSLNWRSNMTLMKSVLLGSAATLVVVAGAQAADLPTKKGAPAAQYVKVCNIAGVAGFVIPGSDTCLKISGGIVAMAAFGSLDAQYATPAEAAAHSHVGATKLRDGYGLSARADVSLETVSNTANGPLIGMIDVHFDQGYGMGLAGPNWSYINSAYLQWAGITAGIKGSFYDYIAGGETWWNIISPEHSGTGVPLFAYTATFGGGFSATVSLEEAAAAEASSGRQVFDGGNQTFGDVNGSSYTNAALGARAPDIVAALDLTQSWGTAHLAGVAHQAAISSPFDGVDDTDWGFGVIGGVGFNLPQLGAGDVFKIQGAYSYAAIGYSGFTTAGWGQGDNGVNINGNGLIYSFADGVENGAGVWAKPTTWEIAADAELHLTPQFEIAPEISYGSLTWSHRGAFTSFEGNMDSWLGGAVFTWAPAKNLSFNLEAVYQYTHWDKGTGDYAAAGVPSDASGFNGRVRVERDF